MAIVKEMMIGATRVLFHDDYYVNRTSEQRQSDIQSVNDTVYELLLEKHVSEKLQEEKRQKKAER